MLLVHAKLSIPAWELQFSFARSSGSGGQNVNKVNSKAELRWHVASSSIPADLKERFRQRFANRINKEGFFLTTSEEYRDQKRNQERCLEKLKSYLLEVLHPPKKRKATKPTYSSQQKRVKHKKGRGEIKSLRKKVQSHD
jgi:ribosome-associated protein